MKKASLKSPHGGHVVVYKSRLSKTFRELGGKGRVVQAPTSCSPRLSPGTA